MKYQIFDRQNNPNPNFPFSVENGKTVPLTPRANEEFSFCLALEPNCDGIFSVIYPELTGKDIIPSASFFSINFGGIDYRGNHFKTEVHGYASRQTLIWITVQIPETASGEYRGMLAVNCGADSVEIPLKLTVNGYAENHGWDEPEKITRLSWLNSKAAENGKITAPYVKPTRNGRTVSILGRTVKVNPNGMPGELISYFDKNICPCDTPHTVCDGIDLFITADGESTSLSDFSVDSSTVLEYEDGFCFRAKSGNADFSAEVETRVEYDGFIGCHAALTPKRELQVDDISLSYRLNHGFDSLMIGLGREGGCCPDDFTFRWNRDKRQNPIWIGGINGGLRCEFKGENFREPFVNIYYRHRRYRPSQAYWNEQNGEYLGGISVHRDGAGATVSAFSGKRVCHSGETLRFDFDGLLTPLKPLDMNSRLSTRYYHAHNLSVAEAAKAGATHIINHHAGDIYPYINYPFRTADKIKEQVDEAHQYGMGAKIYYTMREMTDKIYELNAFQSLGDEIFPAPDGSQKSILWDDSKLKDFTAVFSNKRIPGWITQFDMALITDGQSRLCNYYVKGMEWLCQKVGIDGLYVDDTAYDRYTARRIRRIVDSDGRDAYTGIGAQSPRKLDFHTCNHFFEHFGDANSLNIYMPLLPYIDTVWIGEGFEHMKKPVEYWLTEIAPIPYGEASEMLIENEDAPVAKYRGMLFGATTRIPWNSDDVRDLWRFIRDMKLEDSLLIGFWNDESPAKADNDNVKVSAFLGNENAVLAITAWDGEQTVSVHPTLDLPDYDLNKAYIPEIGNYQEKAEYDGTVTLPAHRGILLVVPKK